MASTGNTPTFHGPVNSNIGQHRQDLAEKSRPGTVLSEMYLAAILFRGSSCIGPARLCAHLFDWVHIIAVAT